MNGEAKPVAADLANLAAALGPEAVVAVLDGDRRVLWASGRFCELFEHALETSHGSILGLCEDQQSADSQEDGGIWRGKLSLRAKGGQTHTLATTLVPVPGRDGRPHGYLAVCSETGEPVATQAALGGTAQELPGPGGRQRKHRDVLEEHAELAREEKLASLGLLASSLAHEINNPLAGIMACSKALRDGTVPRERRDEYFQTIDDALQRIRGAVLALLSYARPRALGLATVDLHRVVRDCLTLMSPVLGRANVTVDVRVAPGFALVAGDRSELMQATMNVLLNAVHASSPGSSISVTAQRTAPGRIALSFDDTGTGIPAAILPRVCEPFFTTKPEGVGTGLGLAITRSVIESNGGTLDIRSEVGRGTCVTFLLPAFGRPVPAP